MEKSRVIKMAKNRKENIKKQMARFKYALNEKLQLLLDYQKPYWIILALVFMGLSIWWSSETKTSIESSSSPLKRSASLDTYVPQGFVLVSLQLINADSISSMMGDFSLVDLYPVQESPYGQEFAMQNLKEKGQHKTLPIASHLRLIRSPLNPALFGVLVPENSREIIRALASPVFGVIKNPNAQRQETIPLETKSLPKKNPRLIRVGDFL